MNKKILIILVLLLFVSLTSVFSYRLVDDEDSYVIAVMNMNYRNDIYRKDLHIDSLYGYSKDYISDDISIKKYKKDECSYIINNYLKNQSDINIIFGTTEINYKAKNIDSFLCVEYSKWNNLKSNVEDLKLRGVYEKNDELVYKDLAEFLDKMKVCGLNKFGFDNIPISETPLICDKYSEKNPIPVIALKDIWEIKKESFQNKRDFNEVLKEFLKNKK